MDCGRARRTDDGVERLVGEVVGEPGLLLAAELYALEKTASEMSIGISRARKTRTTSCP